MVPFEFLVPYSMEEAIGLLDAEDTGIRHTSRHRPAASSQIEIGSAGASR